MRLLALHLGNDIVQVLALCLLLASLSFRLFLLSLLLPVLELLALLRFEGLLLRGLKDGLARQTASHLLDLTLLEQVSHSLAPSFLLFLMGSHGCPLCRDSVELELLVDELERDLSFKRERV
jgi:hypothetical protein